MTGAADGHGGSEAGEATRGERGAHMGSVENAAGAAEADETECRDGASKPAVGSQAEGAAKVGVIQNR